MIRNTPATTIVLECSNAETGVGPSMADGSHGCRPNWADFPVAASRRLISGKEFGVRSRMNICWKSHELEYRKNHVIARIKPISPIRLYRIACRAAVFASVRPCHQLISRNDIMPIPSHPIKSWNKLLAVIRINIVMRKISRYLRNWLIFGSELMYHIENSTIDQVTNNATGVNIMEKKSILKFSDSSMVWIVIQCQFEIIDSWPVKMNIVIDSMLTVKA